MGTVTIAPRSRSRELSVAVGKPMLRGIHHLALVTDDMRMTLDFYVRVLAGRGKPFGCEPTRLVGRLQMARREGGILTHF